MKQPSSEELIQMLQAFEGGSDLANAATPQELLVALVSAHPSASQCLHISWLAEQQHMHPPLNHMFAQIMEQDRLRATEADDMVLGSDSERDGLEIVPEPG